MSLVGPLLLATLLFSVGVYGIIARRNAVLVLISVELMLNAVNINLVAFQNLLFPAQPDAASDIPFTRLLQGRFGASGNGATLAWDGGYLNLNPQPVTVSGGLFGLPTIETGRRLAAGDYTSTVVLTLTPGV